MASQTEETIIPKEPEYERRQEMERKVVEATQICRLQATNQTDSNAKISSEKVCYPKYIQANIIHSFEGQMSINRPLEGE